MPRKDVEQEVDLFKNTEYWIHLYCELQNKLVVSILFNIVLAIVIIVLTIKFFFHNY